nr:immunoglobulin light chain junction region [Macaca mulatta]
CHQESNWPFTF